MAPLQHEPPIGGQGGNGTGGAAGSPVSPDPYVPGPCIELAADAALARFQAGVLGSWMGTGTAPTGWLWSKATVAFTFYCDGHYDSRCLAATEGLDPDSASCIALYYGSDGVSAEKTYEIYDVRSDGKATGNISVFFGNTGGGTTLDRLDAIDLSAAGDRLSFDFVHLGQYGPLHYDLQRAP